MLTQEEKRVLRRLVKASEPFTDDHVVDETSGTIPKMIELEDALDEVGSTFDLRES